MAKPNLSITIDQIDLILNECNLVFTRLSLGEEYFERSRRFTVDGISYRIEFWDNLSYLYVDEKLIIPFNLMKKSNTWPNRSNMNIQFYNHLGEIVAVLPIEPKNDVTDKSQNNSGQPSKI